MKENGFTLIEIMISLVILLVGMLGVMGMQYYAITGNTSSRALRNATSLGQDMVEQLKTSPYSTLVSGSDNPTSGAAISGNVTFERAWSVLANCMYLTFDKTSFPPASSCNVVPDASNTSAVSAIRVRIRWQDKHSEFHYVTLDTVKWDENVVP